MSAVRTFNEPRAQVSRRAVSLALLLCLSPSCKPEGRERFDRDGSGRAHSHRKHETDAGDQQTRQVATVSGSPQAILNALGRLDGSPVSAASRVPKSCNLTGSMGLAPRMPGAQLLPLSQRVLFGAHEHPCAHEEADGPDRDASPGHERANSRDRADLPSTRYGRADRSGLDGPRADRDDERRQSDKETFGRICLPR